MSSHTIIKETLAYIKEYSPEQDEFYQASEEILEALEPLLQKEPKYLQHKILQRIIVPEREIRFRITWIDDQGEIQTNVGYRVQFNSALGPYKGGLRFHPSVRIGIIKFLAFEQIFKNSLTGLLLGGAKGGSDFDPKGKSDNEIMRFCQAFMSEIYKYIGKNRDVPAGDIGVGAREIGYLFGQYKKLTGEFEGVLTGKGIQWGGSLARKEATGYGSVYFAQNFLAQSGQSLHGKRCCVSGSGNVAIYTIEKLYALGAIPLTCSDSRGTIYQEDGIDLELLKEIKEKEHASLEVYASRNNKACYTPRSVYAKDAHAVWSYPCDIAFPSATQNELTLQDAMTLESQGCLLINEGANMPTTADALAYIRKSKMLFSPGKAANAGGVATSQLEMSQNASMRQWSFEEVDERLQEIMTHIFDTAYETSVEFDCAGDLVVGANIAGFRRVADAMIAQGVV